MQNVQPIKEKIGRVNTRFPAWKAFYTNGSFAGNFARGERPSSSESTGASRFSGDVRSKTVSGLVNEGGAHAAFRTWGCQFSGAPAGGAISGAGAGASSSGSCASDAGRRPPTA